MYAIYITRYYYPGELDARKSGLLRDDAGDAQTFQTIEQANAYAKFLQPGGNYRLQHGEYAPPLLSVREYNH